MLYTYALYIVHNRFFMPLFTWLLFVVVTAKKKTRTKRNVESKFCQAKNIRKNWNWKRWHTHFHSYYIYMHADCLPMLVFTYLFLIPELRSVFSACTEMEQAIKGTGVKKIDWRFILNGLSKNMWNWHFSLPLSLSLNWIDNLKLSKKKTEE